MSRRDRPQCARPPVPTDERLIVIGAADPQVLTNLVFAGQRDEAGLVQVTVQPGPERWAVVLLPEGDDVVYAFDDPDRRLSRVIVLLRHGSHVGVHGPAKGIVDFGACRENLRDALAQAALGQQEHRDRGRAALTAVLDRIPEFLAVRNAATVTLPPGPGEAAKGASSSRGTIIYRESASTISRERVDVGQDGTARRQPIETFSKSEIDPEFLVRKDDFPGGFLALDPSAVVSPVQVSISARAR